jgi:hypothetical protein
LFGPGDWMVDLDGALWQSEAELSRQATGRSKASLAGIALVAATLMIGLAGTSQAAAAPSDAGSGSSSGLPKLSATPDVTVMALKVQPSVSWWTLTRRGLLFRVSSDLEVTIKAKIGIVVKGKGFRQIATTSINQAASIQRFRLRPTVTAAGPRRNFCLRYWVGATATDGSGGAGSGCARVKAGRAPNR